MTPQQAAGAGSEVEAGSRQGVIGGGRAPARASLPLGAHIAGSDATFCLWAPNARSVELVLAHPRAGTLPMLQDGEYFSARLGDVEPGQRYGFRLDGGDVLPDPASRFQPDGVHGLSALHPSDFPWTDREWRGLALDDYVFYELHVGTFTPEGTLDAAAARVVELRDLGITAVELMPVAQFPGTRNWGYDGVQPFAVHNSYGGPDALKRFVDRCHAEGIAVCLDVVYNHLGPEGNYLSRFGPYFTDRYHTPWGGALNFDGPGSDEVRAFFIASALQWIEEFHVDALRLDAIHAIIDHSAQPFLRELADRVRECGSRLGRRVVVIAESDLGDPRVVRSASEGGLGMDAQWLDDFHHALHTVLTGERTGYYRDFGRLEQLARAYARGFVYAGEYSEFRQRRHGAPTTSVAPRQFVVYAQNHDQIGNRMLGDRLAAGLTFDQLKLAAAAVLLGPFTPLLFMGEEYGETAPFAYFVSHSDEELLEAVRRGRAEEFADFAWAGEPPDPHAESTFRSAVLDWTLRTHGEHAVLLGLHRELLRVRREMRMLRPSSFAQISTGVETAGGLVRVHTRAGGGESLLFLHFGSAPRQAALPAGTEWRIRLDTAAKQWSGPGRIEPDVVRGGGVLGLAPVSAVLLVRGESRG